MTRFLTVVVVLSFALGCNQNSGSSSQPTLTAAQYNGTYTFSGATVNGVSLTTSGLMETVNLNGNVATIVKSGTGCTITATGTFTVSGNTLNGGTGQDIPTCSPSPCSLSYSINGFPETINCPADFPATTGGTTSVITINGNTLTDTQTITTSTGTKVVIGNFTKQ